MSNALTAVFNERFPSFVKRDYKTFESFMIDYFDYLQQDGHSVDYMQNYLKNFDTSNESSEYWDKILADLGYRLGLNITIEKRQFVTFLRDYYASRGSYNGIYFLFKLLYNEEPTISYPRDDMLVTSAALHEADRFIYVDLTDTNSNDIFLIRNEIAENNLYATGLTSGVKFSVDDFVMLGKIGKFIVSLTGDIKLFETVQLSTGKQLATYGIIELVNPKSNNHVVLNDSININGDMLSGNYFVNKISTGKVDNVKIVSGGTGYKKGDSIITSSQSCGFYATISEVGGNGEILSIDIHNQGYHIKDWPSFTIISENGYNATLECVSDTISQPLQLICYNPAIVSNKFKDKTATNAIINANIAVKSVFTEPKKQKTEIGILGYNGVITDSYYYQQFSYRVNSNISRAEYINTVKSEQHPVGYVLLSRLNVILNGAKPLDVGVTIMVD